MSHIPATALAPEIWLAFHSIEAEAQRQTLSESAERFMRKVIATAIATLLVASYANVATAQSSTPAPARDSLWNGTLIGLGAGIGSAAALDAVSCENGFGGCDFPWVAYVTLGGIGAGTGAVIDFLIGRRPGSGSGTVRLAPIFGDGRKGVLASVTLPLRPPPRLAGRQRDRGSDVLRSGPAPLEFCRCLTLQLTERP